MNSIPNKTFAIKCINLLIDNKKIDDTIISILTNSDTCKQLFHCSGSFAILKEIPNNINHEILKQYRCDNTGRSRYYPNILKINKRCFIITNHWYGPNKSMPDNRTPFYKWVQQITTT